MKTTAIMFLLAAAAASISACGEKCPPTPAPAETAAAPPPAQSVATTPAASVTTEPAAAAPSAEEVKPGGPKGIQWRGCVAGSTVCTQADLNASGLNPLGTELKATGVCEPDNTCRAYLQTAMQCSNSDTVKCKKANGTFGTATCSAGGWSLCN